MKLFVAMLVFMMTAQPLQAGFCVMDAANAGGARAAMQHGDMLHSDMHHGDLQQQGASGDASHGCCQPAPTADGSPCATAHCSGCFVGVAAIPSLTALAGLPPLRSLPFFGDGQLAPSHSAPPFRPPIPIS